MILMRFDMALLWNTDPYSLSSLCYVPWISQKLLNSPADSLFFLWTIILNTEVDRKKTSSQKYQTFKVKEMLENDTPEPNAEVSLLYLLLLMGYN